MNILCQPPQMGIPRRLTRAVAQCDATRRFHLQATSDYHEVGKRTKHCATYEPPPADNLTAEIDYTPPVPNFVTI